MAWDTEQTHLSIIAHPTTNNHCTMLYRAKRFIDCFPVVVFVAVASILCFSQLALVATAEEILAEDACTMNQHCLNGGTCNVVPATSTGYRTCHCQDGYSGPRCSQYCPLDCQNGGYCTKIPHGGVLGIEEPIASFDPSDYMCKCFGHYTGTVCEIPFTNCGDQVRCYHGGECILTEDLIHQCQCPSGYTGESCETVVAGMDIATTSLEEEMVEVEKSRGDNDSSFHSSLVWLLVVSIGCGGMVICRRVRRHWQVPTQIEFSRRNANTKAVERVNLKYDFTNPRSVRYLHDEGFQKVNGAAHEII